MILTASNRNQAVERDTRTMVTRLEGVEKTASTITEIAKLTDAITKSGMSKGPAGGKPISEFKALQALSAFKGERKEFREWNDKLLNALAQVKHGYRDAMKYLNKKLEAMDGVIPDDDSDDLLRILNNRMTMMEYQRADATRRQYEDSRGDMSFTQEDMDKLSEDLWYVLNDKLVGDVRGKLKERLNRRQRHGGLPKGLQVVLGCNGCYPRRHDA